MGKLRVELLRGNRKVGVWGTGFIGFSTLANFAANGVACIGTDVVQSVVDTINAGRIPIPNLEYWLGFEVDPLVRSGMLRATTRWEDLVENEVAVHMIAVPTEKGDEPWDDALIDVTRKIATVADHERHDAPLVIIESTLTPNRTNEVVIPVFEKRGLKVGCRVSRNEPCLPEAVRGHYAHPTQAEGRRLQARSGVKGASGEAMAEADPARIGAHISRGHRI
jgi:UDP-N-acetyl-D-mannosaminuronate dehydrogenase